ncbi:MAG: hypothetical protein WCZ27_05950 [Tissierellaceae bacterium]
MIFPIIMLTLTILGGGGFFIFNKINKINNSKISEKQQTAQDFTNVADIGNFLYSRDKYVFGYLKISPISIELLSDREKRSLAKSLTAELSALQSIFRFIAVSRPIDITPLINNYSQILLDSNDQKQKELLRHEMYSISDYAMNGENVERQFYIRLYQRQEEGAEKELIAKLNDLSERFGRRGVRSNILKEKDIVRLCNLVNNPAYSHIEDSDFKAVIPMMLEMEGIQ